MIQVEGWERFNTQTALKTPSWFKVSTKIASSQSLFGLPISAKWFFICLLAEAMNQRKGKFSLNIKWAAQQWDLKKQDISEAIDFLTERKLLRIDSESTPNQCGALSETDKNRLEEIREDKNRLEGAEVGTAVLLSAPFDTITNELFNSWLKTYEDETWIRLEISKAASWIVANPKKAPKKDFGRFLNNWLSRGWDTYRKSIPSNSVSGIDAWAQKHKGIA